jgi:hypothetical protein
VCLAADVSALPPDFAPYETSCTTTEPYGCVDELGCGYVGGDEQPEGFVMRARLDLGAIDDPETWPPAGARVRIGARTLGPAVTGELSIAYVVRPNGDRGFVYERGDGGDPTTISAIFPSLAEADSPPAQDVLLCYDGMELKGAFPVGQGQAQAFDQPTPAGADRVELLLEVEALSGVDMLGSIEVVELETFALGERLCADAMLE